MGLDITAYRSLAKATDPAMEDGRPVDWQNHFHAAGSCIDFTEENWPGRSAGIERDAVYTFAKSFEFRAGTYGGHNEWRRWLALFAGWPSIEQAWQGKSGPFIELIDFADNEGVIGPVVAADLAKDFADHQERAELFERPDIDREWWLAQYANWRKAFEMAGDCGAVEFH